MSNNDQHLAQSAGNVSPAGMVCGELDHDPGKGRSWQPGMHWVGIQEPQKLMSAQTRFSEFNKDL